MSETMPWSYKGHHSEEIFGTPFNVKIYFGLLLYTPKSKLVKILWNSKCSIVTKNKTSAVKIMSKIKFDVTNFLMKATTSQQYRFLISGQLRVQSWFIKTIFMYVCLQNCKNIFTVKKISPWNCKVRTE